MMRDAAPAAEGAEPAALVAKSLIPPTQVSVRPRQHPMPDLLLGLIGDKIARSKAPPLHFLAGRLAGLDGRLV
jgi:hypothetical protein